jgi:hypothetical protein
VTSWESLPRSRAPPAEAGNEGIIARLPSETREAASDPSPTCEEAAIGTESQGEDAACVAAQGEQRVEPRERLDFRGQQSCSAGQAPGRQGSALPFPGAPIAWFALAVSDIASHPGGRAWSGRIANYLCLFALEGGEHIQRCRQTESFGLTGIVEGVRTAKATGPNFWQGLWARTRKLLNPFQ